MQTAYHHPGEHEGQARQRNRPGVRSTSMQLNLTAMIDVVFQLLIYFIVTANFALDEGLLTAQLPERGQGVAATSEEARRIDIHITSFGAGDPLAYTIRVEPGIGRPRNFTELRTHLQQAKQGEYTEETPVIIHADATVRWQHVVNAFNAAAEQAGFRSVGFAMEN
ncbi:MAG: biopolymer transporter ExbD [Phycisphaeraceae bacterium]|nr:biopolymer transporter ExbD [Phycisphaeraceae bacterium]